MAIAPQVNMVGRLDPLFAGLSATQANDEDSVFGVLDTVLAAGLPLHIAAQGYAHLIRGEGCCVRSTLAKLQRADFMDMGMNMGHAIAVVDCLRPPVEVQAEAAQPPLPQPPPAVKFAAAPAFPAVNAEGLPTARDLTAWMPGVYDTLRERRASTAELKAVFAKPKDAIPADWVHGGAADQALWSVLVRCKDGISTELQLSFPPSVRDGEQGLRAWQHLFERVLIVTDESIAALQAYFDRPPKQNSLLTALTKWKNIVEELEAVGCKPWDPSKRSSLQKVYSAYEPARRAAEALEAMHDDVPVEALLKSLNKVALKISSAAQKGAELGMAAEEERVQGSRSRNFKPRRPEEKTGRCHSHDREAGGCTYGAGCKYNHVGEPGNGFQSGPARPRRESKVDKIGAQLAALITAITPTPTASPPKQKWYLDNINNIYAHLSDEGDSEPQRAAGKLELSREPVLVSSRDNNRPQPNRAARSKDWRKPSVHDTLQGESTLSAPPIPMCSVPEALAAERGVTLGGEASSHENRPVEPVVRSVTECPNGTCSDLSIEGGCCV